MLVFSEKFVNFVRHKPKAKNDGCFGNTSNDNQPGADILFGAGDNLVCAVAVERDSRAAHSGLDCSRCGSGSIRV